MALKNCKECGGEISTKAESCPHCGAKLKHRPGQYGFGTLLVVSALVVWGIIESQDDKTTTPRISDAECRKTLQCWSEKHSTLAAAYCKNEVEKLTKYAYKWTDTALEVKFGYHQWKDKTNGIITYSDDHIQFQNGFGAWQNHIYACDYNPTTKTVIDVRTAPGRL